MLITGWYHMIRYQEKDPVTGEMVGKYRGHIEFKDVCFSFPSERQKLILNGLSFEAKPGQKVAFVGQVRDRALDSPPSG